MGFGRSKVFILKQIQFFDISQIKITELMCVDYGDHTCSWTAGYVNQNYKLDVVKSIHLNWFRNCQSHKI